MLIALKNREFGKDTVVGNILSENLDMLPVRYTASSATSESGQMSCSREPDAGVSLTKNHCNSTAEMGNIPEVS